MLLALLLLAGSTVPEGAPFAPRPFAPAAFAEAKVAGRLAVIIVSRRACPRCRELEAASLEDGAVSAVLAGRFVAVRCDADERPDVARALADALLLLPEPRPAPDPGLPYVVLTTPDLRVVDGTSLLLDGRATGPALLGLLTRWADEWDETRGALEARAGLVLAALREAQSASGAAGPLEPSLLDRPVKGLREAFDRKHAGFGVAPRRIPHGALLFLFEEFERTGEASLRDMACATLDAVLQGLRDPRGGFFREALGEDWSRPVKERTLADNALLLAAFVSAHEATGQDTYAEGARHAAQFLLHGLADPDGGFRHALADGSRGEETDARVFAFANGLALSGLARSGRVLGRREDTAAAVLAADRVLFRLGPLPSLRRFVEGEASGGPAQLEDYAFLAAGLLDLHGATGEKRFREEARQLLDQAVAALADPARGGFFASAADGALRPVRLRDAYDGLLPSGNAVMISALHRFGRSTGETLYTELARRSAAAFAPDLARAPRGLSSLAAAVGGLVGPATTGTAPRDAAFPSRSVQGPVTFEATVRPDRVRPGGSAELTVVMTVSAGSFVVAHDALAGGVSPRDAPNLAPLSLAFPGAKEGFGTPRHPAGQPVVLPGSGDPLRGLSGTSSVTVPLSVPWDAGGGVHRLRVRVVFQVCGTSRGCDSPGSVLLEARYAVAASGPGPS